MPETVEPADLVRIEEELHGLSGRQLLLHMILEQRTANGRCGRHEVDLYGDREHQVVGLKGTVQDLARYADRARVLIKVLVGAVGVLGIANIVELIKVWVGG